MDRLADLMGRQLWNLPIKSTLEFSCSTGLVWLLFCVLFSQRKKILVNMNDKYRIPGLRSEGLDTRESFARDPYSCWRSALGKWSKGNVRNHFALLKAAHYRLAHCSG